jgi:hypothetical protein
MIFQHQHGVQKIQLKTEPKINISLLALNSERGHVLITFLPLIAFSNDMYIYEAVFTLVAMVGNLCIVNNIKQIPIKILLRSMK